MTDKIPTSNRRSVLKTLGGGAAAAGAGGLGLLAMSGGAAANVTLNTDIGGTSYSGDQGDVDYVTADITKTIEWDGFDVPLRYIGFKHEITLDDGGTTGWHVLHDERSDRLPDWSSKNGSSGWGGDGEYVESHGGDKDDYLKGTAKADVQWAIISDGSHPSQYDSVQTAAKWTDRLSVSDDGTTETTTVRWRTTLTFYTEDADDNPVQIDSDDGIPEAQGIETFDVTVTNENSTTTSEADGTTSVA